jgi:hypothetical protein
MLAHIFTAKFVDHLPHSRQVKQFERIGVGASRQDMANWQGESGNDPDFAVCTTQTDAQKGKSAAYGRDESTSNGRRRSQRHAEIVYVAGAWMAARETGGYIQV